MSNNNFCVWVCSPYNYAGVLESYVFSSSSLLSPCYAEYLISDTGGQQLSISDAFIKGNFINSCTWEYVCLLMRVYLGPSTLIDTEKVLEVYLIFLVS
jgi:hypothetical protein